MKTIVKKKIREIINKIFDIKKNNINNLSFNNVDAWDSISHLDLISKIEKEFKIKIKSSEISKLTDEIKIINFIFDSLDNINFYLFKRNNNISIIIRIIFYFNITNLFFTTSASFFTSIISRSFFYIFVKELLNSILNKLELFSKKKINDIKAPMPGMVLNILVNEGDTIKKGDPLIVLEAMKMENILKSPTDGVIKKIPINKGVAVEKNQLLIQF